MQLYIKPGACSLAPHIALREAGLPFELMKVDLAGKTLEDGSNFLAINPKGQVPALVLDGGEILTEGAVLLQYIADQAPAAKLLPAAGSLARYQALAWVNFVATELHKGFTPLFKPNTPENYKPLVREQLASKFAFLDQHLAESAYLAGADYTVADIYCFVVLGWARHVGVDFNGLTHLQAYQARIADRPAVRAALVAEGLA
ncbi:MAG TPA: glutathione transferase GstA [Gammaproteobacteria bacterium]|nr:glutathione transferase GstA [Gammaproteobacteria bacterium]